jgi:hypothetical protein
MTYKVWARSLPTGFLPTSFCKLQVVPTIVLVRLDIPSMVKMPSLWRPAWLGLVPIVAMAAGITVNGLTCPDSDKRGNSWTTTVFNIRDNTIKECDYSGGALCTYFANVSCHSPYVIIFDKGPESASEVFRALPILPTPQMRIMGAQTSSWVCLRIRVYFLGPTVFQWTEQQYMYTVLPRRLPHSPLQQILRAKAHQQGTPLSLSRC